MSIQSKWTLDQLNELIENQIQESLTLDYKDSRSLGKNDGKKNEISKDVSAFANSAGGVIIYGIQEENHLPKCIDEGVDPNEISKEWIEQIIDSRIQRKIDDIQIHSIPVKSDFSRVVYVVEIPQSFRAPHQASDKKFYKRYNFKSQPMEEYEIRDVSRRSETPKLAIISRILDQKIPLKCYSSHHRFSVIDLSLNLVNQSFEPASYAYVLIYMDKEITFADPNIESQIEQDFVRKHMYIYGNLNQIPLILDIGCELKFSQIKVPYPPRQELYTLLWEIRSPRMEVQKGAFLLDFFQDKDEYYYSLTERK